MYGMVCVREGPKLVVVAVVVVFSQFTRVVREIKKGSPLFSCNCWKQEITLTS